MKFQIPIKTFSFSTLMPSSPAKKQRHNGDRNNENSCYYIQIIAATFVPIITVMKFITTKIFILLAYLLLCLIAFSDPRFSKHFMGYIVAFLIILFYYKVITPIIEEYLCIEKVKDLIKVHETALSIQRNRLVTKDIYGNEHEEAWDKEKADFIENTIIKKQLTVREKDILEYVKPYNKVLTFVDNVAKEKSQFFNENIAYSEGLNGLQYELLCKDILNKCGWSVETTKTSGDQGVDLIAKKDNNIVAIQCKKYSSNIGNWAVQEVIAGKNYYKANYAVVVSNAPYTKSAIELANVNHVKLLHHNDLLNEDFFIV